MRSCAVTLANGQSERRSPLSRRTLGASTRVPDMKREQLSEERRRLVGFMRALLAVQRDASQQSGATALQFEQIPWDQAPLSGLRMAAADMVEWCQDIDGERLTRLDADLRAAQLPTLTAMRDGLYRRALGILARDRVRNEAEWHMLNRFVVDTDECSLTSKERVDAERLLAQYREKSNRSD
jgi:hypothetical protein